MTHLVVTTLDAGYWPGLVALHNSFLKHSAEGFDFAALVFGSEVLAQNVAARGIRVILNPPFPVKDLPAGKHQANSLPAMYGRLLAPGLFPEYKRIVYIDADSVILQSLRPLAEMRMTLPLAATRCNGPISYNVKGWKRQGVDEFGPMSSMYVIDNDLWRAYGIDQKWMAAIQDPALSFPFTVQGVLQVAIDLDWHCLPWEMQAHAGHDTLTTKDRRDIYTLHFMGTNPWDPMALHARTEFQEPARQLWSEYLCMSS